MREHKFRAWVENKMHDVYSLVTSNGSIVRIGLARFPFSHDVAPDSLMQYTGLKDNNGKDIYEGDILDCTLSFEGSTLPHRGEVVYDDTHCSFGTKNETGITLFCKHNINTREIIGNIYENPELLS